MVGPLKEKKMHERRFRGEMKMLRTPDRVKLLEVERVIKLCLETFTARTVLDVGTGTGLFAEGFAAQGLEVTGIDANPEMIEAARRFVPQAHFRRAPAELLPYSEDTFDLVFLGLVLHETDDALSALREAHRVARLGVAVLEWPYQEAAYGPPLAHRLRPETVISLAQIAGFQNIDTLPLTQLVLYRLREQKI